MSNRSHAKDIASALRKGVPKVLAFADTYAIANTGATAKPIAYFEVDE